MGLMKKVAAGKAIHAAVKKSGLEGAAKAIVKDVKAGADIKGSICKHVCDDKPKGGRKK